MSTATLVKWGNGQGVNIPKSVCDMLGMSIGDILSISVENGAVTLTPTKHRRSGRYTAAQIFDGWEGEYAPLDDFPSRGSEVSWGEPVGNETW